MKTDSIATVVIFAVLAVLFLAGMISLLVSVYDIGDNYPVYSTHRSDPLGLRVYYEALNRLDSPGATRNLEDLARIGDGDGRTLIIAGATRWADPRVYIEKLERFVTTGGRLVIVFEPLVDAGLESDLVQDPEKLNDGTSEDPGTPPESSPDRLTPAQDEDPEFADIQERWGFRYKLINLPESKPSMIAIRTVENCGLPEFMGWHSLSGFEPLDAAWESLYRVFDFSVVMHRKLGEGSLVLCSDTFQLSNEALANQPATGFLTWLAGESDLVVFDEWHLGIRANPGVMTLIHRYRLTGFIILALVFAVLWLWSGMYVLIPRQRAPLLPGTILENGRDATGGLANLLMRHIPEKDLLNRCLETWQKDASGVNAKTADMMKNLIDAEAERTGGKADVTVLYRRLTALQKERKQEHGN